MKNGTGYLKIDMVEGRQAPHYAEGVELVCTGVTITEQATELGLPIVDFKMRGPNGQLYVMVLSGRLVNAVAAAVRGANMRNHGVAEP